MANDINKEDPHYKGEFGSIYEVNKKFPTGGVAGDFVVIEGWVHYWNADRGSWCVNAERDSYWDELITNIIEKFKLVRGATYMGVASLGTVPEKIIGAKQYYFATEAGTYKNFGDLVVPQGINVLYSENGSSWVNTTLLEVAQELGVSTQKVVSQKVLNDAFLKKFDKENIVQKSGDSEDKVMSQKVVSDKLSDLGLPVRSMSVLGDGTNYKIDNFKYPFEVGKRYYLHAVKSALFGGEVYLQTDGSASSSARVQTIKLPVALDGWVSFVVEKTCSYLSIVSIVPNGVTMEVSLHINGTAYEAYKANSDLSSYKDEVAEYKNTNCHSENLALPIVSQKPGYGNSVDILFQNNAEIIFYVDKKGIEHRIKHLESNKVNGGYKYTLQQFEALFLDLQNNTLLISSDTKNLNKEQYVTYAYSAYGVISEGEILKALATEGLLSTRNNLYVFDNLMNSAGYTIEKGTSNSIKLTLKNTKDGYIFVNLNQAGYGKEYRAAIDSGQFYVNGNFEVTLANKEYLVMDLRAGTIYKESIYKNIYSNGDFSDKIILIYNYYGILLGSYADFLHRQISEYKQINVIKKLDTIESEEDGFDDKRKEIYNSLLKSSPSSDSFVFYTDTHIPANKKGSLKIIKNILKETGVNKVVYGGDSEAYYGDTSSLLSSAMYQYGKCYNELKPYAQVLNVRGNHDFFTTNQDNTYNVYNQEQTFNIICKPMIGTCHFNENDKNSCYYYYDDTKSKIRYIICDGTDITNSDGPAYLLGPQYSFGTKQSQWIVEEAILKIPTEYNFIICIHEGVDGALNPDSASVYSELLKIVKYCKSKPSQASVAGANYNFSSLNADLLCVISGHIHRDTQTYCEGIPLIATACDAAYGDNKQNLLGFPSLPRTGVNEQCVDTFIIDKDKNKIDVIRIGVGYNRHFNLEQKNVSKGSSINLITSLQGTITWVSYNASGITFSDSTGWTKPNDIVSVSNGSIQGLKEGEAVVVAYNENYESEFWSISVVE